MKGFPSIAVTGLAVVLFCAPALSGQTAGPATPPPTADLKIEDLPGRLAKIDQDSVQQIKKLREVVETEAKEKRLSEPNVQSLRWSLQTLTENLHTPEAHSLLDTVRIPPDNQALSDAYRNVTTAVAGLTAQRSALLSQAQGLVRREVSQAMTGHQTPAEMATAIASLETIRDQIPRGPYATADGRAISGGVEILNWLRRLAEAEASGDPGRINDIVDEWTTVQTSALGLYSESERKERLARATGGYLGKVETAFKTLDAQIAAGKPAAECASTLAPVEAILNQQADAPSGKTFGRLNDAQAAMAIYRQILNALKAMDGGDFAAAQGFLREVKTGAFQPSGRFGPAARTTANTLQVKLADRARKQVAEQRGTLAKKIVEAKDPAELRKYVEELTRLHTIASEISTSGRSDENDHWSRVSEELSALATAWENSSLALMQQSRFMEPREQNLPFGDEMASLRQRVEHEILAHVLNAPELKQAPLAGQPPAAAMENLANDLAARGEWRRLYKIVETQVALAPFAPLAADQEQTPQRKTLEALTNFFAGQNLELAEQWTDAIESYKAVLKNPTERSPVAAAAERIKAILKAHPQAASTPAPSLR
jgi:hypothetical protein